jgi:holo-[acyl-carrier protein] synthase
LQIRCGTDLVQIKRIAQAVERQGGPFLHRLFTDRELADCRTSQSLSESFRFSSLAARFAGKEAIAKALGTGIGPLGIGWTDLEIIKTASGAPIVVLHGAAKTRYDELAGRSIAISLAHEQDQAMAHCVILCGDGTP